MAFVHEFESQIERKKGWKIVVMTLSLTRPEVVWGGRRPVLAVGACPCWPEGPGQIFLKTSTNTVRLFEQILLEYACVSKSNGSWVQFEIGLAETIRLGSLMADNQSPTTCLSHTIWLDFGFLRLTVFHIAKDCLLAGQEQACTRITKLVGCSMSPWRKWPNTQENICWLPSRDHIKTENLFRAIHDQERGMIGPVSLLHSWHWVLFSELLQA